MARKKKSELNAEVENTNENITETPNVPIDPLLGSPVIQRDYSGKGAFEVNGQMIDSVEEPEQKKIMVNMDGTPTEEDEESEEPEDFDGEREEPKRVRKTAERPVEEEYEIPDGEPSLDSKTMAQMAGNMADFIVDGYKTLLSVGKAVGKRTREDCQMEAIQGKFDMRVLDFKVDVGNGDYIKYGDFLESYNEMTDAIMVLDKDKEKKMRELTKRVCKKHEVGMSDEWSLALLFGGDVVQKGVLIVKQRKMMKNVENYVSQLFKKQSVLEQQRAETARRVEKVVEKNVEEKQNVETTAEPPVIIPESIMETKEKGE